MAVQFLLLPFFLLFLYKVFTIRLSKRYKDVELQRLYKIGLLLKFFGGFLFFLIYTYYYIYGDTFGYFKSGNLIVNLLPSDPNGFLKFIFSPPANYDGIDNLKYGHIVYEFGNYFKDADTWLMVKFCSIASLVTFKSYLFATFLFSSFSFYGLWKMFIVFDSRYPELRKYLFFAIFGIPSVLFWGSGILKDTVTIGCLGIVFFQLNKLFFRGKINVISILILVVNSLLILTLKGYILLAFIPPLLVGLFFFYINNVNGFFTKSLIASFLLVGFVFGGAFLLQYFAQVSQEFSLDRIASLAEGFHDYHGYLDETGQAGSGYKLNISSYTLNGMLGVFPQAVNVTLFRPYIWEANSPVMLISSVESLLFILFTLKVLIKKRFFGFFRNMFDPFAIMCILYSLVLSFAIGITAFNFGALVRFKIPLIPFYLIGLLIIQNISKKPAKNGKIDAIEEEINVT